MLRGSTASALETDSDYSTEEASGELQQRFRVKEHSLAEALITSRARDLSGNRSREHSSSRLKRVPLEAKVSPMQRAAREEKKRPATGRQSRVDNKWARKEDPQYKLRRSVKHVIDPMRMATPDLSHIESRIDTGLKKQKLTPRGMTPPLVAPFYRTQSPQDGFFFSSQDGDRIATGSSETAAFGEEEQPRAKARPKTPTKIPSKAAGGAGLEPSRLVKGKRASIAGT